MILLLDTHALLRWLDEPTLLSDAARAEIAKLENDVFVGAAVVREIVIKSRLGKLTVPGDLDRVVRQSGFRYLAVTVEHAFRVRTLPDHHRDPFDRILIAQSIVENATLVTRDDQVLKYPIASLVA